MDTSEITQAKDEELFSSIEKGKKKKKRKRLITILVIVAVVIAGLLIAVNMLRKKVTSTFADDTDVTSAEATIGSISTTVSGSGQLSEVDEEELSVPAGVKIEEVLVSAHDTVSEGDTLATLDISSVMSAMSDIQSDIDDLDEELADAEEDTVSSSITAGVTGRVKKIFAAAGDDVIQCMYDNGALALLSLDGYMSAEIETDALSAGDTVTVERENGKTVSGTVETAGSGTAVILVSDDGPEYGETVKVYSESGDEVGSGELAIHNPLCITGISGTVSNIRSRENSKVYSSTVLFTLKDTSYSANYDALLKERNEKEETLVELVGLYRSGALLAPFSGSISSVDYDEDEYSSTSETQICTMSPDESMSVSINIDESDIMSIEVGQSAQVTIDSVSDDAFTGEVTEINKTASSSSGVTRYSAVITIPKESGMLAGMSASVVIRIEGVDGAVIIPVDALHQTSSVSYVYTSYNEETKQFEGLVEVVAGISNSSYVEITSGLSEGDTVYYTEEESFGFGSFSFGDMSGGGMSDFSGEMPSGDFGGGDMPSGGGGGKSGGGGGGMPSGGGGGGMPSGGGFGG